MPPKKQAPKPISLNEEQRAVVSARLGTFQVVAGPGSGKSACLVARFAELISEGVSPNDVASLSFTSTAAKNLKDRVEAIVGKLTTTRKAGATTFHGLALDFAISERDLFPFTLAEFPLAPEPLANKLSGLAARRYEVDPRALRSVISVMKRERIRDSEAVKTAENKLDAAGLKYALAYRQYQKALKENGVLDFDSLILEMVEILEKKPDVRKRWVRDYVMVDEAQDCAKIEWDLIKLISGRSLMCVGDISQGLYSFRGSDPKLFAAMSEMFPGTVTLMLARNYRSSPQIVDFIRPYAVSQELAEKFHTQNPDGAVPVVKGFLTQAEEVKWVVEQLKEEA